MATLNTSLSAAKSQKPNYSYSYQPPRIPSPYPNYPPMQQGATPTGANSGLYSAILGRTQQESQRVQPSTRFAQPMSYDPILARIAAMGTMNEENAKAENQALRKRAIIDTGLTDVGSEIGIDEQTLAAAKGNPFSGINLLEREKLQRNREMDEALQTGNLFFSGERMRRMQDLETNAAQTQAGFVQGLRDTLAQGSNVLLAVQDRERQAAAQAALAKLLGSSAAGGRPGAAVPSAPGPGGVVPPVTQAEIPGGTMAPSGSVIVPLPQIEYDYGMPMEDDIYAGLAGLRGPIAR